MQVPLDISFRNMEHSDELADRIRERVDQLERFCERITACRVVVEAPHHHHRQGNLYRVRVYLSVPQRDLVVDRDPCEHHAHEDVNVAIRDAFKAARRQLEDYVREIRGQTKHHEQPAHGIVKQLVHDPGYGFIETPDGREVYFHFNSVLGNDLDRLEIGCQVRFIEEPGDEGPQATSVQLVGAHHQFAE